MLMRVRSCRRAPPPCYLKCLSKILVPSSSKQGPGRRRVQENDLSSERSNQFPCTREHSKILYTSTSGWIPSKYPPEAITVKFSEQNYCWRNTDCLQTLMNPSRPYLAPMGRIQHLFSSADISQGFLRLYLEILSSLKEGFSLEAPEIRI